MARTKQTQRRVYASSDPVDASTPAYDRERDRDSTTVVPLPSKPFMRSGVVKVTQHITDDVVHCDCCTREVFTADAHEVVVDAVTRNSRFGLLGDAWLDIVQYWCDDCHRECAACGTSLDAVDSDTFVACMDDDAYKCVCYCVGCTPEGYVHEDDEALPE